jgi:hypothetical protein
MDRYEAALKLINDKLHLDACEHVRGGEIIMYVPDHEYGGVNKTYMSPTEIRELAAALATIASCMKQVQSPPGT